MLPNDVSRCGGGMGDSRCPLRDRCKRFLQIGIDGKNYPDGMPLSISYTFDLRDKKGDCGHYLEMSDD